MWTALVYRWTSLKWAKQIDYKAQHPVLSSHHSLKRGYRFVFPVSENYLEDIFNADETEMFLLNLTAEKQKNAGGRKKWNEINLSSN